MAEGNCCYVRAALVCIISAVHIQFSGVNTGEGDEPSTTRLSLPGLPKDPVIKK